MFKQYLAYLRDNPEGKWFKPKLFGWGWTPARWQGWVTIGLFVLFLVWDFRRLDAVSQSPSDAVQPFLVHLVIAIAILLTICVIKGDRPRWQWGIPDKYKQQ